MICYQVSFSLRHLTPPSLRSVEPSPFLHHLPFVNRMIVDFGSFWCWLLFCCVGKHLILTIRLPVSCILSTWICTNADVNAVTVSSRWERAGVSRGTGSAGIYQWGRWTWPSHFCCRSNRGRSTPSMHHLWPNACRPFQGDQPRLASVLEEAFSKFYSRNGSLNPVTVSS